MQFIDLHSDYLYKTYKNEEQSFFQSNLEKLTKGNCMLQTFAILFNRYEEKNLLNYYERILEIFKQFLNDNASKIVQVKNYNDIKKNIEEGKISALLSLEDSQILCESDENIEKLYKDGVRIAGLLWDGENDFGYSYKEANGALKKKGIETIEKLEDIGMIIDVSHLSDKGFDDVVKYSKKPFIATHSNARSLTNHHRNLTDENLKTLATREGLIGINFFAKYIDLYEISENSNSKIEYIIAHIKHIINCAGEDCIAFGCDFDGIPDFSIPKMEIKDAEMFPTLYQKMEKEFPDRILEKIFYKNALNFFKNNLK